MGHNIFGNRVAVAREAAWHRLGTVFKEEDKLSATQALQLGNMTYNTHSLPVMVLLPDGTYQKIDNNIAVMREPVADDPEWRNFGIASTSYAILQNADLAAMIDPLTDKWPVETVGALGKGETIFFTLKAGNVSIDKYKELLEQYFLITDTRDGTAGLKVAFIPHRVVCQNTLKSGLAAATVNVSVTHNAKTFLRDVSFYMSVAAKLQDAQDKTIETFERMMEVKVNWDEVERIVHDAFPKPPMPKRVEMSQGLDVTSDMKTLVDKSLEAYHIACERADRDRVGSIVNYYKFNTDFPQMAETAWAAVNAVVEHIDHGDTVRGQGGPRRAASVMFGIGADQKARAFSTAMSFCN